MLKEIKQAVVDGDMDGVIKLTNEATSQGLGAQQILDEALMPAMDIVGEEYAKGDRYIPEMLLSATVMRGAVAVLKPLLVNAKVKARGKVVIGTVARDLHNIGKDLVAMMLEGAGFEVIDLGIDVTAGEFLKAAKEHSPHILAMSALLTTTMIYMPEVIDAIRGAGLRDQLKVIIGGAPVTQGYADKIGADGYAADAASAAKLAKSLV
ncbi:MAG: Methionine synthase [Dehalococcoidia bacterium]|nr:Methionine synthase [Bacillota bacterium]MBT9143161.1 Methionine synthase [Bacillota bacterium]